MKPLRGATCVALASLAGCVAPRAEPPRAPEPRPSEAPSSVQPGPPAQASGAFAIEGVFQQGGWVRGVVPPGTSAVRLGEEAVELDSAGRFFAAFDRDAPASLTLTAMRGSGSPVTRKLVIAARDWQIERVNVPLRGSMPSEEFMAIRRPELAAIAAARATRSSTEGWRQGFVWPVKGRISGRFGAQRIYQGVPGSYHSGLDIAPGAGAPYVAPADGVVVLAAEKPFTLEGNLVILDHGMGLNSAFLHAAKIMVRQGERVRQGQVIGIIGATGRATGPHLHWSLTWQGARLDPLLFLPEP